MITVDRKHPTFFAEVKGVDISKPLAPAVFAESDDPDRLVPIVVDPEDFMIAVTGDQLRTNAMTFAHNGMLGYPVAKRIELPGTWPAPRTT